MAQKTIYVRDEDLKIFEEAEELSKKEGIEEHSLSSIIAASLQMYINQKEAITKGFRLTNLAIGIHTEYLDYENHIEFLGKEIARHSEKNDTKKKNYTLYQTYKGKLLLYVEEKNLLERSGKSWHKIYDNIVEVEAPDSLFKKAQEEMEETPTFYIDV